MSLLQDIQIDLLNEQTKIGPILLKLRYLADRLGSSELDEWVRHETEGYPKGQDIPDYRKTTITYTGTFTDGFRTLNQVGIAPYLIKKHGGESWVDYSITDALPLVEEMTSQVALDGFFSLDSGNLKMLISDKIYSGMTCIELTARIDRSAFVRIILAVRAKLLDLTLSLERNVPVSKIVTIGPISEVSPSEKKKITQITNNIFHGPVNNITSTGALAQLSINVVQGDKESLISALSATGLPNDEAAELAAIAASEKPEAGKSFGVKAAKWIGDRVLIGVDGALKIGGKVLEDDVTTLLRKFYEGIKGSL